MFLTSTTSTDGWFAKVALLHETNKQSRQLLQALDQIMYLSEECNRDWWLQVQTLWTVDTNI